MRATIRPHAITLTKAHRNDSQRVCPGLSTVSEAFLMFMPISMFSLFIYAQKYSFSITRKQRVTNSAGVTSLFIGGK